MYMCKSLLATACSILTQGGLWPPEREIEKSIVVLHAKQSDDCSAIYLFLNSISEVRVRLFPFLNVAA